MTKARSTTLRRWSTTTRIGWPGAMLLENGRASSYRLGERGVPAFVSVQSSWQSRAHFFAVCARVMRLQTAPGSFLHAWPAEKEQLQDLALVRDRKLAKSWLRRELSKEQSRGR